MALDLVGRVAGHAADLRVAVSLQVEQLDASPLPLAEIRWTTIYKLRQLVPDERIPGTMLVGHTLPVAVQAFAFISVVAVDPRQLVLLIIAMMAGGWLGAGTVSRLPRRVIQVGMAAALLLAGMFMTMVLLQLYPATRHVPGSFTSASGC